MGAGPEHLLANGLEGHLLRQGHTVTTSIISTSGGPRPEIGTAFELMGLVSVDVRTAIGDARFPIVLSGNCGTASGTLAGLTPSRRAVLWFDAHGDANTPDTTITGFVDGTALATALGWCWHGLADRIPGFEPVDASAVRLIGTRDLDSDEAALLDRAAVRRISPAELRGSALDDALASLPKGLQAYVHCDLDVLDPDEGQANVFPVPGGLDVETLVQAIGKIGSALPIAAAAVTAYAPEYDGDGRICRAAFRAIDAILAAADSPRQDRS